MCLRIAAVTRIANRARPIRRALNSPFVKACSGDIFDGFKAFKEARRLYVDAGRTANLANSGLQRASSWVGFQAKGAFAGSKALIRQTGPFPAVTAGIGFLSGIPGGTSFGLGLGIILKNVYKSSKNLISGLEFAKFFKAFRP